MTRIVLGLLPVAAVGFTSAAAPPFPSALNLPRGFQPEGIAISGTTFYVGSIPSGAIWRGDLRTGKGSLLVRAKAGRSAVGVAADARGRLFVAGGITGRAFVYNAKTGALIRSYQLATMPTVSMTTFVNDVVVTRRAVYFTDSLRPFLYRIPIGADGKLGAATKPIAFGGQLVYNDFGFNANGIEATSDGRTLIVVQTNTGLLYRIDPATGITREIPLEFRERVGAGDGILLDGHTLYVVQNQQNRIAVVALADDLESGEIVDRLQSTRFDWPTTVDDYGRRLYVVDARFGVASPETATYQVIQVRKPSVP